MYITYTFFSTHSWMKIKTFLKLLSVQIAHVSTNRAADIKVLYRFETFQNPWVIITHQKHSPLFTDRKIKIYRTIHFLIWSIK